MFTMRGQGTLEPRKVDKLEDMSGTTLHQSWFGAMARQDDFVMKAVPIQ